MKRESFSARGTGETKANSSLSWRVRAPIWEAWGPGLESRSDWKRWLNSNRDLPRGKAEPECVSVPPRLRRRCGLLDRMVLEVSLRACRLAGLSPDSPHLVLVSRHGKIEALGRLLEMLAGDEPLSPTQFSNSVHHTPVGFLALSAENRGVIRTLSAGEHGLACGCLESLMLLRRGAGSHVLLLVADELPPPPFAAQAPHPEFPFAAALLWEAGEGSDSVELALEPASESGAGGLEKAVTGDASIFALLQWLLGDRGQPLRMSAPFGVLTWRC